MSKFYDAVIQRSVKTSKLNDTQMKYCLKELS